MANVDSVPAGKYGKAEPIAAAVIPDQRRKTTIDDATRYRIGVRLAGQL